MTDTPRQIKDWRAWRHDLASLLATIGDPELLVIHRAVRHTSRPDGYSTGQGGTRSTNIANPTATAACNLPERGEDTARTELVRAIDDLHAASIHAQKAMAHYARWQKHAVINVEERAALRAGEGTCEACGDHVPGVGNDRLRAGYCVACTAAYKRAGSPDRMTFRATRTKTDATHE